MYTIKAKSEILREILLFLFDNGMKGEFYSNLIELPDSFGVDSTLARLTQKFDADTFSITYEDTDI